MTANTVVIGDADSLIALFLDYDSNHKRATSILTKLDQAGIIVIYPNTAIAEAITALLRKHSNPELALYLARQYRDDRFTVEYVDEKIMKASVDVFNPQGSKQNTFFDCIIVAIAQKHNADGIFSFDHFYKNKGFKLASELKKG